MVDFHPAELVAGFAEIDIAHDADDRHPLALFTEPDALSDRIFIGPITAGHLFVDDHRRRSVYRIFGAERAALQYRNPQGSEVMRISVVERQGTFWVSRVRPPPLP